MRIDVLNGVNLDLLGRRDPALYGEARCPDLETQIYAWARELDLQVRCRQTNHEGEYVEWLHQALDGRRRARPQPRRVVALLVGDPRRGRGGSRPARRGAHLERRRARGVAPQQRARRADRAGGSSAGASRAIARRWLLAEAEAVSRLARLAGRLEEPLLVTSGVNVRYLTGFASSNAALLVEPGRHDALHGLPLRRGGGRSRGRRARGDATRLLGLVASDSPAVASRSRRRTLSYASYRRLAAAGVDLLPTNGVVEALRAVKDADEIAAMRRAAAISDQVFEALTQERFMGRTERELAWWIDRRFRELGAERAPFDDDRRVRRHGGAAARRPARRPDPGRDDRHRRRGRVVDGYCSDCTRTFATGDLPQQLHELYELVPAGAARRRSRRSGRARPSRRRRGRRASRSRLPGSASSTATGSVTASGSRSTRRRCCGRVARSYARAGQRRHRRAGRLPAGHGGVRIEDLVSGRGLTELLTRAPERAVYEGRRCRRSGDATVAGRAWPRSSPRTSSRTGCTSSTRARCGGSSSSST